MELVLPLDRKSTKISLTTLLTPAESFLIADCELTEGEQRLFMGAYEAFIKQAVLDCLPAENIEVTMLVLTSDIFTLSIKDDRPPEKQSAGYSPSFVVYPLHRWREQGYNTAQKCVCILEELCHRCFGIAHEALVAYKVHEIFQLLLPRTHISEIYCPEKYIPEQYPERYARAEELSNAHLQ